MPEVIRQYITDLSLSKASSIHESTLKKMASFYDRVDDKEQVENAMIKRWGMGIAKKSADVDGVCDSTIETYVHEAFKDKVNRGEVDAINTGFVHKIADAKGTLFTEPGGSMSLTHETVDDLEAPQKLLERHRKLGGYKATLTASDRFSAYMGSTGVMVAPQRGALRYYQVKPGDIRAFFGSTIIERTSPDDEPEVRTVDRTRIQDASIVLVRLGLVDESDYAWIAIVPRNNEYEYGRYVAFTAPSEVTKLPEPGEEDVFDYEIDGTRCNPLSWFAHHNPEYDIPEIPIAIMYGGTTDSKELFPVSLSLYRLGISLDAKQSHIHDKADQKAAGTLAIETSQEAEGKPLPRTLTGAIHLLPGQKIEDIAHDASACQIAHLLLKDTRIAAASSFSVPDFMSESEDHTLDASSGVALAIKAKPLVRDRDFREEINQPFVRDLFHIEQAYLAFKQWDPEDIIDLLLECDQVWDSGGLQLPQNTKELSEELHLVMNDGYMDIVEAMRRYYQLPSDEEAKAMYRRMVERREEFPPLNQKEKETQNQDDFVKNLKGDVE
jgi:hypothetical protein